MGELDRTAELMTDDEIGEVTMTIRKILVPTDGSATAIEATSVAIALAKCVGAEVIALFVGPGHVEDPMQYAEQENLEGVRHSSAGLDVARKMGEKNNVSVTMLQCQGAVGHEVIDAAKKHDAQMIVIGSEGRTGYKRMMLGSVAESVIKEATVPVLVVRHDSTNFGMQPRT